jgi:hypothetical protein
LRDRRSVILSAGEGHPALPRDHFTSIGLLDWKVFDRIVKLGYECAKEQLANISPEELEPYGNPDRASKKVTTA